LLAVAVLVVSGSAILYQADAQERRRRRPRPRPAVAQNNASILEVHLGEGADSAEPPAQHPLAVATPLDEKATQAVLARLQPLAEDPGASFALREGSLPPPRTGKNVAEAFPPAGSLARPDPVAVGPLEVLRYSPEGEVPLAPNLSITFSQPMVAVTSHAEAIKTLPVKLSPEVTGTWRWIGTKTLLFEPAPRFPMATRYTVTVPEGTVSATGNKLAKTVSWTFGTPAPKVTSFLPGGEPQPRTPLLFAAFDQAIDPAAVLATVKVSVEAKDFPVALATTAEVASDAAIQQAAAGAGEHRWLAFRAKEHFPGDSAVRVAFGPGTPSAEGPRVTDAPQVEGFRTYGPLKIVEQYPRRGDVAQPRSGFSVYFNNPLDTRSFKTELLTVEPAIKDLKASAAGNWIQLYGTTTPRTTYKVTIKGTLGDIFDGTLGEDQTLEFQVGEAPAYLWGGEGLVVLDPQAPSHFSVYSVNQSKLNVTVKRVTPDDWRLFCAYQRDWNNHQDGTPWPVLPGTSVFEKTIEVAGKDETVETRVDLAAAFEDKLGQAIVCVEPPEQPKERWNRQRVLVWVEATQIGVEAFVDNERLLGWASALRDGKPLEGVELSIVPSGAKGTTEADGLASIELPKKSRDTSVLVARKGKDVAILPENTYWWNNGSSWIKRPANDWLAWYVADDRHLYRPGEEVHLKGWLRRIGGGKTGDVGPLGDAAKRVGYRIVDPQGNELGKGQCPINVLGGFDLAFKLPGTCNLGSARVELQAAGGKLGGVYYHGFEVQEFRRPEFEVSSQASDGPHVLGGDANVTVTAAYYSGGPLPNAEVSWNVTVTPGSFTPPNRSDFTFGTWVPWWISYWSGGESQSVGYQAHTDASGKHHLNVAFESMARPRPVSVTAEATVMDVNRQAWTTQTSLLVHPASIYVGLKSDRTFVEKGDPFHVDAIVTDLDGNAVAGRTIKVRSVRLDWDFENGSYVEKEKDVQEKTIESTDKTVRFTVETTEGGTYKVSAEATDAKDRPNRSELTLWVAGGKSLPSRGVAQQVVQLIPDKREYQPGDVAEILVQTPFYPAEAIVSLRRSGLVMTKRISLTGPSYTVKIPVEDGYTPNVHVQVDVVGAAPRTGEDGQVDTKLPPRPAYATGSLSLPVPPLRRRLTLTAKPREAAIEPGGETTVDVDLKDLAGLPVAGGEVAVIVVDESVLALTGYRLPDPIGVFYQQRGADVSDHHLLEHVTLATAGELQTAANGAVPAPPAAPAMGGAPGGGAKAKRAMLAMDKDEAKKSDDKPASDPGAPIKMRADFNALAVFAAAVPTDASGHADVKVKVPDSLTRYRLMAVGVAGGQHFGQGESTIVARLPIMVRPSPPRFLNFGDRFELPVVIQNQLSEALEIDVAVRATNATITSGAGLRVKVAANDRVEVRFGAKAARAGTAHFQVGVASGSHSDAAEFKFPVWTPATTEAFATYGEIDEGSEVQPIQMPSGVVTEFGGLEVETSSTALQALTDAVLYLEAYPFECAEQLSSRVLAIASLKDVLSAFEAEGLPSASAMTAAVDRDIARLQGMQNDDGGFGFWHRGDEEWPYLTIHVANALARARAKGFAVPKEMLERSSAYLKNVESHYRSHYGAEIRWTLSAYALDVRMLLGDRDAKKARALMKEATLEALPLEALGWLLPVLSGDEESTQQVEAIRKHLNNRVSEEAGTAHFTTAYKDGGYLLLASDRRADGVILEALILDQPKNDLIPKIVRGLLAHRKAGRWGNTQENAFILLALDRYFQTYEKETPDFVAKAWLGDRYAGDHAFKGRSTDRVDVKIPMAVLAEGPATKDLTIAKEGTGRLYYRIGLRYAPSSLQLEASEHGFTVMRSYEAVDDPADVHRDDAGVWHVKAGAKVRVRLTMVAPSVRYHVALVDPLPAGLEAMNPALAVTGTIPEDKQDAPRKGGWWWWRSTWFEHQNLRDERAEAFTSYLWEGVHDYSYVCRATTPGSFVVPPAKAEEMYEPETFGRSATDKLVVE
jgi:uncharacterized protein YfaS (alpha-2-macroglobulin family)